MFKGRKRRFRSLRGGFGGGKGVWFKMRGEMIRKDSEVIEDYTVTNEKWSVWFEESTAAHGEKQELDRKSVV